MRPLLFAVLVGTIPPASAGVFGAEELLQPEQAFRLSSRALDARTIEVVFEIAQGYYMYRDRFRFAAASGQALVADIPRGEVKNDPFFGRTEILRREARIRVVIAAAAKGSVELDVTSQGCADQGVCFLPQTQRVRVALPAR